MTQADTKQLKRRLVLAPRATWGHGATLAFQPPGGSRDACASLSRQNAPRFHLYVCEAHQADTTLSVVSFLSAGVSCALPERVTLTAILLLNATPADLASIPMTLALFSVTTARPDAGRVPSTARIGQNAAQPILAPTGRTASLAHLASRQQVQTAVPVRPDMLTRIPMRQRHVPSALLVTTHTQMQTLQALAKSRARAVALAGRTLIAIQLL